MNTPFEGKLRQSMVVSTADIAPSPVLGSEVVRLGRSARRRRRVLAVGAVAAVVLSISMVAVLVVGRPTAQVNPPTGTPPASSTPSAPSASSTPSGTATVVAAPPLDVLDKNNTIHTAAGQKVRIPVPSGETATLADRVAGGWVVTSPTGLLGLAPVRFFGDDGRLREFAPPLRGNPHAFSADDRLMVTYVAPYLYVFELPSLNVRKRIDASGRNGGAQVEQVWLVADRAVAQYRAMGDGAPNAFSGVVVWNIATGTETASPSVDLLDVSADGTTAVLHRTQGVGPDARACVSVVAFGDRLPASGAMFCAPERSPGAVSVARLSPGGAWLAAVITTSGSDATAWFYRTADIRSGTGQPVTVDIKGDPTVPLGWMYFAGWPTATTVIVAEERLELVVSCPVDGGTCARVTMPPSSQAIIG